MKAAENVKDRGGLNGKKEELKSLEGKGGCGRTLYGKKVCLRGFIRSAKNSGISRKNGKKHLSNLTEEGYLGGGNWTKKKGERERVADGTTRIAPPILSLELKGAQSHIPTGLQKKMHGENLRARNRGGGLVCTTARVVPDGARQKTQEGPPRR